MRHMSGITFVQIHWILFEYSFCTRSIRHHQFANVEFVIMKIKFIRCAKAILKHGCLLFTMQPSIYSHYVQISLALQ